MDEYFRERLSFGEHANVLTHRENWRDALSLLLDPEEILKQDQQLIVELEELLFSVKDFVEQGASYLEWVLAEESHSTAVILIPYLRDGHSLYRIPSLSYLLGHSNLAFFDRSWATFFAKRFSCDGTKVELGFGLAVQAILLALTRIGRLHLTPQDRPLCLEKPLRLEARLRFSEEWGLWALDAELISVEGVCISPRSLDFILSTGLVAYEGGLFPLPVGAVWIAQLASSGTWYIAKENLGECLYQLSKRIYDSEFLAQLSEVHCVREIGLPIVYLKSKNFEQNTKISLYLAHRYEHCEIFSSWHSGDRRDLPIGFESSTETCTLYFRNFLDETEKEVQLCNEIEMEFVATKSVWVVQVSSLCGVIHKLLKRGWEVWAEKLKIDELSSFGMDANAGIGWFELKPLDRNSGEWIDPLQLIRYLKRRALFIRLGHDRICVLPERWITHLLRFLGIGHLEENKSWRFSSLYAAEIEGSLRDAPSFQADKGFHSIIEGLRYSFDRLQPLAQPEGLRAILRPYQLLGLTWLNLLCDLNVGGILADDMGLGKTVQVLALLQHRIVNQVDLSPQKILVVCPKSVQEHWEFQAKNLVPRLKSHILKADDISLGSQSQEHTLFLASYGLVRYNIELFLKWNFDLLFIDEAQIIKNDSSQISQIIKKLPATQRFALTGTPIENRFQELVSIFSFLNPYAQLDLGAEEANADTVRSFVKRALHPFVLRRLKEDVLTDLPSKTVEVLSLAMSPVQEGLHQKLIEVYRNEIKKYKNTEALPTQEATAFFLEGLLRLRQVATYPQQLIAETYQSYISNKLEYLAEQIPKLINNGHKIVVFSQFLGFLASLSERMKTLNIRHSYVDGETPDREKVLFLFQSNLAIKVLCISLKVGGIGIDLTSADVCILVDPWWNEAVEKQAIDRLHRFGQKKPIMILRLVSANSIEEKMEILKQNKSKLVDALGKTKPDFLEQLRWEDFTEIF